MKTTRYNLTLLAAAAILTLGQSPTAQTPVHAVEALTTSTATWRQVKRSDVLGSSAPDSSPASHSTWKPLQMPSTSPPRAAKRSTSASPTASTS